MYFQASVSASTTDFVLVSLPSKLNKLILSVPQASASVYLVIDTGLAGEARTRYEIVAGGQIILNNVIGLESFYMVSSAGIPATLQTWVI